MADAALIGCLSEVVADTDLILEEGERAYYSADIANSGTVADIVVRPRDVDALRQVVAAATGHGHAVVPRGSEYSYSGGGVPPRARSVVVDTTALDRVVEINEFDGYVRVEAGCTWARLHEALAERGLRPPFFGPLSGHKATIGGTLSQGAAFFGSAVHGYSNKRVMGLTVVLADGRLMRTGSGWDGKPHPRPTGIDSGGLFLGDCGAFGIKAEATLLLRPLSDCVLFASFDFPDSASFLRAQVALTRVADIGECFGFDRAAHARLVRGGFESLTGPRVRREGISVGARVSIEPDQRHAV